MLVGLAARVLAEIASRLAAITVLMTEFIEKYLKVSFNYGLAGAIIWAIRGIASDQDQVFQRGCERPPTCFAKKRLTY
jgi:hypothetical protein